MSASRQLILVNLFASYKPFQLLKSNAPLTEMTVESKEFLFSIRKAHW